MYFIFYPLDVFSERAYPYNLPIVLYTDFPFSDAACIDKDLLVIESTACALQQIGGKTRVKSSQLSSKARVIIKISIISISR